MDGVWPSFCKDRLNLRPIDDLAFFGMMNYRWFFTLDLKALEQHSQLKYSTKLNSSPHNKSSLAVKLAVDVEKVLD